MLGVSPRGLLACVCAAASVCSAIALVLADDSVRPSHARPTLTAAAVAASREPPEVDALWALAHARREGNQLVAVDAFGRRIELSVLPALQERAARIFADNQVPYGALVAIEPESGRILAYVSHSSANPHAEDLARDPTPPAASVFKLITASALVDAGVTPDTSVCYNGGSSRLQAANLVDDKRRDGRCASLADALGSSINAVIAKLADRHLDPATLRRYASSFGFGQKLPLSLPLPASAFDVPDERLEFARTAAGFWHVHMSPLHAALIAAAFANDGSMPRPTLVQRVVGPDGSVYASPHGELRSVVSKATARTVGRMMLRTVRDGTCRNSFMDARGRPALPGVQVAGKTGSLSANDPYRAYSWWVGFAPAEKPTIAVAALVVNSETWRIKSSFVARELLHEYLFDSAKRAPPSAAGTRTRR
jgi:penicillin-binding protein A